MLHRELHGARGKHARVRALFCPLMYQTPGNSSDDNNNNDDDDDHDNSYNSNNNIIIIVVIIIIIIVMTFKGTNREFYNLLTAPRTVSNTYAQVAIAQSCATHRATHWTLIACNMPCATTCEGTAQQ